MAFSFEARQIRKSFGGVEVLHGVDLGASAGEVLALLGENGAGKSTLVKIMSGDYQADSGELVVEGESFEVLTPRQARDLGVAIISQEFQDAPPLSVAENISLGRLPSKGGMVRWGEMRKRAVDILDELEIKIDPAALVGSLRIGERQLVEIARALSHSAKLLILDEPTAALSHHEAEVLFDFIRKLRSQGAAIVYITHRLDEVGLIADRVQVLRDGSTALVAEVPSTDRRAMIEAMIGRKSDESGRPAPITHDLGAEAALRWTGAGAENRFEGIDLEVRPGEVVAVYGKLGSGAAELAETAFGIRELDAGRLEVRGESADYATPAGAVQRGIGFLPAERKAGGALMVRSVAENTAVASWPLLAKFGQWITARVENKAYRRWHDRLSIRSRNDPRQIMRTLSGGNQQKVLISRWLERRSQVMVLVEPTRGVDVGARRDIYGALRELASAGIAVLVVTSDYEEAVQVADRCLVIAKGRAVAELSGDDITMSGLLEASGG